MVTDKAVCVITLLCFAKHMAMNCSIKACVCVCVTLATHACVYTVVASQVA